ncbi:MAG TPA: shikimate dehydrogenase [Sphingomicrobium sp.]|nr:shikimate dehydrogenase [Sphingomicrobium sp.]
MSGGARDFAEVIGDPIAHSLSPVVHCFWLKRLGIQAGYRRFRVGRGELADYVAQRRRDPRWRGCNVTMPLKLDALALADQASDRALGAGAANTLALRDGRLLAGNTDVGAVMVLISNLAKAGAGMDEVTLLGSGGAARAALMALHLLGLHSVRIQARDRAKAYKLAVEFRLALEPVPFDEPLRSSGLINATPLGMTGMPPLEVDMTAMPGNGWVFDLVSSPQPTKLVRAAADRGLRTIGGLEMLVEQAAESFELLFGAEAPRDRDDELMQRLRR